MSHAKSKMPSRRQKILVVELLEDRTLMSASPAPEIELLATPNDPRFNSGSLYGLTKINAPTAWNTTTGSTKIVVANIDTGVDYMHPDLYKNIWINQNEIPASVRAAIMSAANWDVDGDGLITFWDLNDARNQGDGKITDRDADGRITGADILKTVAQGGWSDGVDTDANGYRDDLIGWDFVNEDNNPYDDNGHGTHTAGTIGAVGNNGTGVVGVNWQVQIMALKILAGNGGGYLTDAADAITYSGRNGARVSNNSWGFSDSGETTSGTKYTYLYNAIKNTPQVLFVAAAGNNGVNNNTSGSRNFPATYNLANIISVAATDSRDRRASFSAYGSTTVDLGAPGVGIVSTVPGGGYASYSGTSMATPHVTGAAALLLAKNATLSPAAVKSAILNNVTRVSAMNQTVSGGRLDLAKALNSVAASQASFTSGSTTASGAASPGRTRGFAAGLGFFDTNSLVAGQTDFTTIGSNVIAFSDFRGDARVFSFDSRVASTTSVVLTFDVKTLLSQPLPATVSTSPLSAFGQSFGAGFVGERVEDAEPNDMNPEPKRPEATPRVPAPASMNQSRRLDEVLPSNPSPFDLVHSDAEGGSLEAKAIDIEVRVNDAEPAAPGLVARSVSKILGLTAAIAFIAQGALLGRSRNAGSERDERATVPVK